VKINTTFWKKPIPRSVGRKYDWEATYEDYQGGDPMGFGATEAEAIEDLKAAYAERYECQHDIDEQKADADSYTEVGHAAEVE
jgi:hypothetical protein